MIFHIYQSREDPAHFLVTDETHLHDRRIRRLTNPPDMTKVGSFNPMGEERLAFNEKIATSAIRAQGFYEFDSRDAIVMGVPA